ncbi:Peroxidase [Trema orientale]|uniref:peroxidase n=1 Tax=Trema orientale TaxID=63057 RepID=A0A2P5FKD2_TREOI|nr:Peroxidase [Trema orientale]
MVMLFGAHSVGVSCCASFSIWLYTPDLSIDLEVTLNRPDNMYYVSLEKRHGVLGSDQGLMNSPLTTKMVRSNARDGGAWGKKFAEAMVKMGSIKVLIGSFGEIRKNCRSMN